MARNTRRYLLILLAILALAFLLYKLGNAITIERFHWAMVIESLHQARISLLLLSVMAIYGCYALRALRWMRFSQTLGETHFWNVYSGTLMGFACLFLLGRPGEPVRPLLIAKKDSLSMPGMFGVWVLERIFDMASTAILTGVALLMFERRGIGGGQEGAIMKVARSAGVGLLLGLTAVVALLIYFRYHGGGWLARRLQEPAWRSGWRGRVALLLEGFSAGLQGMRTWGDFAALVGYTAAHWLLVVLVYLWIAHAFGGRLGELSFSGAVLVLAFTMIGSALQAPGVGGGAQVATFLVFTLIFGVEKEPAAMASIVLWLITFAACSLAGIPLLFCEGWSMGELRRMAREEEQAGEAALLEEAEHAGAPEGKTL
jgi:hypothetical protein